MRPSQSTRWQSLRRRPFREQIRAIALFSLLAAIYTFALIGEQPFADRSFEHIYRINTERQIEAVELKKEQMLQSSENEETPLLRGSKEAGDEVEQSELGEQQEEESKEKGKRRRRRRQEDAESPFFWYIYALIMFFYLRNRRALLARYRTPPPTRALLDRINRARRQNGVRPLSAETLRLMMNDEDFTANDYERLLALHNDDAESNRTRGLSASSMNRFPQRPVNPSQDHQCSICLDQYGQHDMLRTLPCSHSFHTRCIDRWCEQVAECPICKQNLSEGR